MFLLATEVGKNVHMPACTQAHTHTHTYTAYVHTATVFSFTTLYFNLFAGFTAIVLTLSTDAERPEHTVIKSAENV